MLRNIPNRFTVAQVSIQLDKMGFRDQYDMCLIPIDPHSGHGRGYGFLNFTHAEAAARFAEVSYTYNYERGGSKAMQVAYARIQGRKATLEQHVSSKNRKKARAAESKCLIMRNNAGEFEHMGINRALDLVAESESARDAPAVVLDEHTTPPQFPYLAMLRR
jgi:hypothetical protein